MNKIVLAGKITADAKAMFRDRCAGRYEIVEIASKDELGDVRDAAYIVTRGVPLMEPEIDQLTQDVRLIHRWGVGYDSVDIEAAGKKGIAVAICAGGNAQPVAEMTVLLMLAAYRKLTALLARAKEGTKEKEDIIRQSYLLQGKTVGLVGLGNIGSRVCRMVQGFGAAVQYYDVFRASTESETALNIRYVNLEELLKTSDIVSLHLPLLDSTRHMIGKKEFQMMKPTALLVNTARGAIVDTEAMLSALQNDEIAGAAIDTIEGEPLPVGHPIFDNPKVLLTPHGAGNTCDNNVNMVDIIMKNIDAMESGQIPEGRYLVNKQYLNI